ncbi:endonuclease domain-containing protein [Aurantiacibacter poecillastricola]|uniref:endonuclease domain-containing protein n=1 Tax=Aurantiacibacter poecillastricola TaxID=3064385 RepID=UPI00273EBBCF|nr:endonuclease domain-containing protein [Aurantiacibacter sp. 219JJ12-13]MDP5261795.1 endonuclease domain-containing protein [Aurantiacibacter sp. 219JJ12-13]
MSRSTSRRTVEMAKSLRQDMTLPEIRLWQILRRKPEGLKFRRQHPIGPFVLDFYCASAKVGIEIDGKAHDMSGRPEADGRRDEILRERGISIVRIAASEVLTDAEGVAAAICAMCRPA